MTFMFFGTIMSSVSQCCQEMRFVETKPKILTKKGFVLSVTHSSIFACPNRAPIPLSPWAVESEKGLRASQVGTD